MIAIDTNILVRYLVKDDRSQELLATQFLGTHQCIVLKTVLLEVVWVLSSKTGYSLPRDTVVSKNQAFVAFTKGHYGRPSECGFGFGMV